MCFLKKSNKKINDMDFEIVKYNPEKAKKTYIFFKNIYIWKSIEIWQNCDENFPNDDIDIILQKKVKKIERYFKYIETNITNIYYVDKDIKEIMNYTLMFDIKNKNDAMYNERIKKIYENIISYKPIKNPNYPIFHIFGQPLFYYFINKSIPNEAKDFLKVPSSVLKETLIPVYNNYTDNKIDKNYNYLLFYNDKSILIEKDGYSASMSYIHLLCIPKQKIYNCISLNKIDYKLIEEMKSSIQKYMDIDNNFINCLAEFGTRTIDYIQKNDKFNFSDFGLLENNNISNIFIKVLLKIYNKFKNIKYEIKNVYDELLIELNDNILNMKDLNKKFNFYFHIHPFHGVGYLHMHCIYEPLKTKTWNHFITQFIKIEDLIYI
jgi:hypothetical protein